MSDMREELEALRDKYADESGETMFFGDVVSELDASSLPNTP